MISEFQVRGRWSVPDTGIVAKLITPLRGFGRSPYEGPRPTDPAPDKQKTATERPRQWQETE